MDKINSIVFHTISFKTKQSADNRLRFQYKITFFHPEKGECIDPEYLCNRVRTVCSTLFSHIVYQKAAALSTPYFFFFSSFHFCTILYSLYRLVWVIAAIKHGKLKTKFIPKNAPMAPTGCIQATKRQISIKTITVKPQSRTTVLPFTLGVISDS